MATTPSSTLLTQSQSAFLVSLITYPLAFQLLARAPTSSSGTAGTGVSPVHIAKAREAISFLHCTGMTIGCLWCLYTHREALYPTESTHLPSQLASLASSLSSSVSLSSSPSSASQSNHLSTQRNDSALPVIAARPTSAHILTAIETAYLLQDSVVLAYYALRLSKTSSPSSSSSKTSTSTTSITNTTANPPNIKGLNLTHLSLHHALLSTAFLTLQSYIHSRRDRGILVIVILMLMNASSPFGTVRWWVVNFYTGKNRRRAIALATLAYLCVFGVCRVGVIWWVLRVFGRQRGEINGLGPRGTTGKMSGELPDEDGNRQSPGAWEVYRDLRWQCQAGTGLIGVVNTWWLVSGWMRFVRRDLKVLIG